MSSEAGHVIPEPVQQRDNGNTRRLWYSFGGTKFSVVGPFEYVSDVAVAIHQQLGPRISSSPLLIDLSLSDNEKQRLLPEEAVDTIPQACSLPPPKGVPSLSSCYLVVHIPTTTATERSSSTTRQGGRAQATPPRRGNNTPSRVHPRCEASGGDASIAAGQGSAETGVREANKQFQEVLETSRAALAENKDDAGTPKKERAEPTAAATSRMSLSRDVRELVEQEVAFGLRGIERRLAAIASSHKGMTDAIERLLTQQRPPSTVAQTTTAKPPPAPQLSAPNCK